MIEHLVEKFKNKQKEQQILFLLEREIKKAINKSLENDKVNNNGYIAIPQYGVRTSFEYIELLHSIEIFNKRMIKRRVNIKAFVREYEEDEVNMDLFCGNFSNVNILVQIF